MAAGAFAALSLAACTGGPATGSGAGSGAGGEDPGAAGETLVLGDPQPLGGYNPINGYGELGVSPLYDGLLRPQSSTDGALPALVPALAAADPVGNADSTRWEVDLREGVTFSDGSAFDAADVVATYEAVSDPASASAVAAAYDVIGSVTALDRHRVRFDLTHPYSAFPVLLLLGIAPSEALTGGPAVDSALNRAPIGTGPYVLADLSADQAVFEAREDYWRGEPEVSRFVVAHLPDDNARAQRMRAGGLDGTVLPPRLAATFEGVDGVQVVSARSADWRGVSLPATNPFTADEAARIAMNLGADRAGLIADVLAGRGRPAHTPAAAVYGDAFDPAATFAYDPDRARTMLDEAGWLPGPDGIRERGDDRAEFTLMYPASDSLRRDVATAFAADMAALGIRVELEGASWDRMDARLPDVAILFGGGDKPYDLDTQLYGVLHSRGPETAPYDNPAGLTIPGVDAALDRARRSLEEGERAEAYRAAQAAYIDHPTHVLLTFLDHTYVIADDDWDRGPLVLEPHSHGVTWGPWWNMAGWRGSP
ncbi:ABC transporter substrate-binding protein [Pseudactinotalea sp. HY160]|nr:ABC transporter substrate-binding protein [Pseudactinotalea sp. HY160]